MKALQPNESVEKRRNPWLAGILWSPRQLDESSVRVWEPLEGSNIEGRMELRLHSQKQNPSQGMIMSYENDVDQGQMFL
jgi:hypothetical protein